MAKRLIVKKQSENQESLALTTLLIMLAIVILPCLLDLAWSLASHRELNTHRAGAVGLGLLFLFTGIGHFLLTEAMAQMLPAWVPEKLPLVYFTGILELAVGFCFFIPRFRRLAGWIAVGMLVLFLPVNIYAAINHIPLGGHAWGPIYLLIRVPLQLFIMLWAYWFTIRPGYSANSNASLLVENR